MYKHTRCLDAELQLSEETDRGERDDLLLALPQKPSQKSSDPRLLLTLSSNITSLSNLFILKFLFIKVEIPLILKIKRSRLPVWRLPVLWLQPIKPVWEERPSKTS